MIYQLNNTTHWELSAEFMRELIDIIDSELLMDSEQPPDMRWPERTVVELCNFRSALECEVFRLRDIAQLSRTKDNDDLIG